jgi:hypothetical protein
MGFIPRNKVSRSAIDHPPPHLALKVKKEYSYTSPPPLALNGLFYGEFYFFYLMLLFETFFPQVNNW